MNWLCNEFSLVACLLVFMTPNVIVDLPAAAYVPYAPCTIPRGEKPDSRFFGVLAT